jgi:hypothetical protein
MAVKKGPPPWAEDFAKIRVGVWRDTLMISPQFLFWIARNAVE